MADSSKAAYERFRFKHRVCFQVCGLYQGKGGFCPAKKENIDYCLAIDKELQDCRDYRSRNTALEWLGIFADEEKIPFIPDKHLLGRIDTELKNSRKDCYTIAKEIIREIGETYESKSSLQS